MGSSSSSPEKKLGPDGKPLVPEEDQLIPADVFTRIGKLRDILQGYNENDPNFITKYIDDYNKTVTQQGKSELVLNTDSPAFKEQLKRLDNFHTSLVQNITNSPGLTIEEVKNNQAYQDTLKKTLNNVPDLLTTTLPEIAKKLINKQVNELYTDRLINNNQQVKGTVTDILSMIVKMKARYSFFEYKYVQMNVLLLVIVQNMYNTMISSITNIIALYKTQNQQRNVDVANIFKIMLSILQSAELQIQPEDFDKLSLMIKTVKDQTEIDQKNLSDMSNEYKANAQKAIDNIGIGADQLVTPVASSVTGTRTGIGGFIRSKSRTQKAGFVRDSSTFPAAEFNSIDNIGN
jgi:hypothetical protein